MKTRTSNLSKENETRLTEDDLSKSLLTVEDVATQLKLSTEKVLELITNKKLWTTDFPDDSIDPTLNLDKIRVKKDCLDLYLRRKEFDDAIVAFSIVIRKFDLTEEEIKHILPPYNSLIYYNTDIYTNNDCSLIYEQFRQLQQDHPDDWRHYIKLDKNKNWEKPDQYIINKNGDIREIWDYVNYLKVSGPKDQLSEFEKMFTIDGYPTLKKLLPVPEWEDLRKQLLEMRDLVGVSSDKIDKEEDEQDWCSWNWGPTYDIDKSSTMVFGVKGKNKIFTAFNSEPIYQWLENIQIWFPKLTFLTYYRSSSRNLWGVWKTDRKDNDIKFKHYVRDLSDVFSDPFEIIKHEAIIQNILQFDESIRTEGNRLNQMGFSQLKSTSDFE